MECSRSTQGSRRGFGQTVVADCLLFNLRDMETQHAAAKQNRGKWITVRFNLDLYGSRHDGVCFSRSSRVRDLPFFLHTHLVLLHFTLFFHSLVISITGSLPLSSSSSVCHVQVRSDDVGERDDILLLQLGSVDVNYSDVPSVTTIT